MLRLFCLIIFISVLSVPGRAQHQGDSLKTGIADSLKAGDSIGKIKPLTFDSLRAGDSISKRPLARTEWQVTANLPLEQQVWQQHPYFLFNTRPVAIRSDIKLFHGKELMFYVIVALVMLFALLKLAFSKYFTDLFRVFFRTTLKQRQIKEQLMQTPFPSLVFNIFFVASAGLYINFILHYFEITPVSSFWLLYLYCCIGLSVIYLGKFVGLTICGWLFNMKKAADSYIFIVFIINKVIGVALIPFLILLAFTDGVMYSVALVTSWCCIGGLLLYRLILGFAAIRNEVRFNIFHFFLYLCAFEVAPLLLIYKALLFFF